MKVVNKVIISTIVLLIISIVVYASFIKQDFIIENYNKSSKCIEQVINYKEAYTESAIEVKYGNKVFGYKDVESVFLEKEVDIDTYTLGSYELVYDVIINNKKEKIKKVIKVKDLESPVIEINDKAPINVCPNNKYYTVNYTVNDNYDGIISNKLKMVLNDKKLLLRVSDSSGNETEKALDVKYIDEEKPVLKLNGSDMYKMVVGSKYNEQGAVAIDNCEGDISSRIVIESTVNADKVGTYTVIYTVTDMSNNTSTITRTVSVFPKNNTNSKGKIIYLTFDDGPGPYTKKLLNILDKYNVKATFFVTNQYPIYQSLIKEEYQRGHAVGIHTYGHDYSYIYRNLDNYYNDFNRMSAIIKKQTGVETTLVRLPGGSSNTISRQYCRGIMSSITISLTQKGYKYFDWNVTSGDAGATTKTSKVVSNVVAAMRGNTTLVVLQHDIKNFSVDAVESIIQEGLIRGYSFQKLDEYSFTSHHTVNN